MSLKSNLLTNSSRLTNTTVLFLLSAPLVIFLYASFVFDPANIDNLFLYIIQIIADGISIIVLLSLWLTILMDVIIPAHHRGYTAAQIKNIATKMPKVDVFITVAGENPATVRKTVAAAVAMDHDHTTTILDDGRSPEIKAIAAEFRIRYISRADRLFAKSGNVNNGLLHSTSEYFVIFDADHVPKKSFLTTTLSYMEDERVGMVQTPQYYRNTRNFIAAGTAQAQEVFYKFICPAKNTSNSAFCVGTNVLFRRKAIDEIGGISLVNHSEDIWTSVHLHEKKWKTVFVNEILAIGEAPENITSFMKQQLRWAQGGLSMMFLKNPLLSTKLSVDQRLQYFSANFFYLVGFSMLAYLLFPIVYLLFGIKSLQTENGIDWLLHYLPYFGLYYSLTWLLLGKIQMATIATALGSFYAYIWALVTVIFGANTQWEATSAQGKKETPIMAWIWPHVLLILLTLGGLVVGWYRPLNFWTTFYNSIWAIANMYFLYVFITSERRIVVQNTHEELT